MIPLEQAHLRVAARSHPGMRGKNNEDRFAVSAHRLESADSPRSIFAVVTDGIGGHRAGEVAAEIAVEEISRTVAESSGLEPVETLTRAIIRASRRIHDQAQKIREQNGMGATCVCVWIIEDRLFAASVGDSRLYLIRNDSIFQLTTDHTWIREAIDQGILTAEQADDHPNVHIIRRYLGSEHTVVPDFRLKFNSQGDDHESEANQGARLLPGDRLVLCTDGLSDLVNDREILGAMLSPNLNASLDGLIDLANSRGGHDNITIIGIESPLTPADAGQFALENESGRRRGQPLLMIFALFLLCLVAAVLTYLLAQFSSRFLGFG